MTSLIEFPVRALLDLEVLYFEKNVAESKAAARWFNGLQGAILGLSAFPNRCPIAPESKGAKLELRHLLYGKKPHVYRVIFELDEARSLVKVLHIRYGGRQDLFDPEL
jgi:toxin ParE1/3/4